MLDTIALHVQALPFAVQLVGLMVLLAFADFAMAMIVHVKNGTFHGTLIGQWVYSKGLPIVVVAFLYGLDAAFSVLSIELADTDLGAFGLLAYAQAATFIAQEAMSVIKNARLFSPTDPNAPVTEP